MKNCPTCGYMYVKRMDLVKAALETARDIPDMPNLITKDWVADEGAAKTLEALESPQFREFKGFDKYWWCGMCGCAHLEETAVTNVVSEGV